MSSGIIVFAHGSRLEPANEAVRQVAANLAHASGNPHVEAAFLELAQPDLEGAVERLLGRGVGRILVIPYFLTLGRHADRDLPALVNGILSRRPEAAIRIAPPLDGHPALVQILADRASEALDEWG